MCACFFSVCVLCASRSPGATEKSTHREDELYIESAPLAEILSNVCQTLPNSKKIYTDWWLIPCDFPKIYTDWWLIHATFPSNTQFKKRLFAITMRPPPKQSVQIWPTLPLSKRLLEFLVPTPYATHLGNICVRISPVFHITFLA